MPYCPCRRLRLWNIRGGVVFSYWIGHYGYLAIISLLVLGIVGLPVPDETLLAFVGYLCFKGDLRLPMAIAAAFAGSIGGISVSYTIGRIGGVYLVKKYGHRVHLDADKLERARHWFNRAGKWALLFGYFIPGVRHLTAYVAGTARLQFPVFAAFAWCGGFVWSLTFVTLGYIAGREWHRVSGISHHILVLILWPLAAILATLLGLTLYKGNNRALVAIQRRMRRIAGKLTAESGRAMPGDSSHGKGDESIGPESSVPETERDSRSDASRR